MAGPVVLFDVMDTLVVEPFYREAPVFFGLTLEELLVQKHPTAWQDFEQGESDEATFLARFFRDGRDFDRAGFKRALTGNYRWVAGMEELLAELAGHVPGIHALSNYPEWYRIIEGRLRLSRFLSWSFVSCLTGVRKPDPRAFTGALGALGLAAGSLLLIDDREENCAVARAHGLGAIRFRGAAQLRTELVQRGLLP